MGGWSNLVTPRRIRSAASPEPTGLAGPDTSRGLLGNVNSGPAPFCAKSNKKGLPEQPFKSIWCCQSRLFDLGFLEFHMFANHRIIFAIMQLFGLGARILLGYVVIAGVCRAYEFDLDGGCFSHFYLQRQFAPIIRISEQLYGASRFQSQQRLGVSGQ